MKFFNALRDAKANLHVYRAGVHGFAKAENQRSLDRGVVLVDGILGVDKAMSLPRAYGIPAIAMIGAGVIAALGGTGARAGGAGMRDVTVDATVAVGDLRPLSGVNRAPAPEFVGPALPNAQDIAHNDVSALYRAARIDLIRTHDAFGPGDIDARFGDESGLVKIPADRSRLAIFPDMNADAENPKSYNFGPTDRLVASIRSVGAEPLFRLGRSIGAAADPPADFDKYAQIAKHIVLHYNQGWNKGFRYRIRYWEIWNEPDLKVFWTGTPQQYYALYEKTARAIQSADDTAQIGGPAIAKPLDGGAYREAFMDFVRLNRLPLNFFSWHFNSLDSNDPYDFVSIARTLRVILDARGFGSARNVLDEWNADLSDRDMSKAARAAFAASALIYMLGGPVDAQAYSRGDTAFRGADGGPDQVAHALTVFGSLKSTPILLRTSGGDDAGFAVVAGRSADSRTIQILISNYQIAPKFLGARPGGDVVHIPNIMDIQLPPRRTLTYHDNGGYDAAITLPKPGKYRVRRYRISESANFTLVDQSIQSGPSIHLQAELPPPGIEFIVLSAN
jgi:xylan 1,4-beta-xylosidase